MPAAYAVCAHGVPAIAADSGYDVNRQDAVTMLHASRPGELIVKFRDGSGVAMKATASARFKSSSVVRVDRLMRDLGVSEVEELMPLTGGNTARKRVRSYDGREVEAQPLEKLFLIRFDSSNGLSPVEAAGRFGELPEVEFAEPNYLAFINASGSAADFVGEPMYSQQWGIPAMGIDKLWQVEPVSDKRPVIAIIDTGVDITHPDLAANIWTNTRENVGAAGYDDDGNGFVDDVHGWDFVNRTAVMLDFNGHGTHVAGVAAAVGNNGIGITGANPDAFIMPVAVMQANGSGDVGTIIKGIDYAVANGADVINMSLGTYNYSSALEQSLANAYAAGTILVAAAGNDAKCVEAKGWPCHMDRCQPQFPAAFSFVLGVQASDTSGALAGFSNFDHTGLFSPSTSEEQQYNYEIKAPGTDILSTYPGGKYKTLSGTSMAAPLVSGALSRYITSRTFLNREVLFGDLFHSTDANGVLDIFKAYGMRDEDRRPALAIIALDQRDETPYLKSDRHGAEYPVPDELKFLIDGGDAPFGLTKEELEALIDGRTVARPDGDGRADAGEIIELYPVIKNQWGDARNIRLKIESVELAQGPYEIITPEADFGYDLSGYGRNKSVNPLRIRFHDDCADGRVNMFRLTATCDNGEPVVQEIEIVVENGVELSGTITEDTTLYPDVHYIVTTNVAVASKVRLTILPGTVIKFKDNTGISLYVGDNYNKNGVVGYHDKALLDAQGTPDSPIVFTKADLSQGYNVRIELGKGNDVRYARFTGFGSVEFGSTASVNLYDCEISDSYIVSYPRGSKVRCTISGNRIVSDFSSSDTNTNYIGNNAEIRGVAYGTANNSFSNYKDFGGERYFISDYYTVSTTGVVHMSAPSYFGSTDSEILKSTIWDINNPFNTTPSLGGRTYAELDLSNMLTRPSAEAHGIVWKILVDGYDTQDEFGIMPPMGVGEHKVEVYFNRPMAKDRKPTVGMGVRPPYTQMLMDGGEWNEAGDIYTCTMKIDGRGGYDGLNRLYVAGAQDEDSFLIPVENVRFNVNVQSAGSLSTGFTGEAGVGCVKLAWEDLDMNFEDIMGYNMYRIDPEKEHLILDESGKPVYDYTTGGYKTELRSDTIMVNRGLIEAGTTVLTDYDVTPGETYRYFYKVMTTAMTENDPSKVIAVTPLTAIMGDANGSGAVDVNDILTTVNYIGGDNPRPFIFDAADMNADTEINILDVVGIAQMVIGAVPSSVQASAMPETACYWIEDGMLYLQTNEAVGGIQLQIKAPRETVFTPAGSLAGFETMGGWSADGEYVFLSFSLSGKSLAPGTYPVLTVGDEGEITRIVLGDTSSSPREIPVEKAPSAMLDNVLGDNDRQCVPEGVYNLMGVKLAGEASALDRMPAGIYIVNGQKIMKR